MKFSIRQNFHDGMALIMVMIAITVFTILATALWFSMKVETHLAQRSDHEQQLLWLGRSGVEYARWILSQQASIAGEPYDSLNQIWAGGPGGADETNSVLAGISLDNYPIGEGTVSIKIIDRERFVNINTANAQELQQVLTLMGVDADSISVVADSILDWVDTDDSPRLAGAESDYYQSLTPPYYAKNAPIDDLSELLLVKGVTPEMYYGGSATNSSAPQRPQNPKLGFGNAPGQTLPPGPTLPPDTLPPGPPEAPTGLVAGAFWTALTGVGVDPGIARCAADDLVATTSEADLLALGIASTPRPAAVNALLDASAKRCGVTQAQLDAAAAAAG